MSLLDTTINTPITDIDQLFDLGFKTQYGLNYCFFDVPYTFDEQKIWICVRFKAYIKQDKCIIEVQPTHLRQAHENKNRSNRKVTIWLPINTSFSICVQEYEITHIETLQIMITEHWVKTWFIQMIKDGCIIFLGSSALFNK